VSEFEIRNATFDDVEAITRLEEESFPTPWKSAFFDSELRAASRYNRVAVDGGGNLLGYVFAMYYFDEMHINKIAVQESMRRYGLASALMADCTKFAREHNVRTLSLEVRKSNSGAIAFYERLHFVAVYNRPDYYPDGEAAVVMMAGIGT
jgi:[ribosomal protein S18]-alanine N-acetyltransferase